MTAYGRHRDVGGICSAGEDLPIPLVLDLPRFYGPGRDSRLLRRRRCGERATLIRGVTPAAMRAIPLDNVGNKFQVGCEIRPGRQGVLVYVCITGEAGHKRDDKLTIMVDE